MTSRDDGKFPPPVSSFAPKPKSHAVEISAIVDHNVRPNHVPDDRLRQLEHAVTQSISGNTRPQPQYQLQSTRQMIATLFRELTYREMIGVVKELQAFEEMCATEGKPDLAKMFDCWAYKVQEEDNANVTRLPSNKETT